MRRAAVLFLSLTLLAGVGCGGCELLPTPAEPEADEAETAKETAAGEFLRAPEAITGVTWEWISTTTPVEQTVVPDPARYTILLQPDGQLRARFDCNRGGGKYEIEEGRLSFGPLISTRVACPEDSLDAPFMMDLQRVSSFFVRDGELYLEMPMDSGTLRFRASGT
jgi:heat shock protein HslJ